MRGAFFVFAACLGTLALAAQDPFLSDFIIGKRPQRFEKRCTHLFHRFANGSATVRIEDQNDMFKQWQTEGRISADWQLHLDLADKDKDGLLTRDELCQAIKDQLMAYRRSDVEAIHFNDEMKQSLRQALCGIDDRASIHLAGTVCDVLEDNNDDDDEDEKGQSPSSPSVALVKRSSFAATFIGSVSIALGVIMLIFAFTAFGMFGVFFGPIMFVIDIALAILFFVLGARYLRRE